MLTFSNRTHSFVYKIATCIGVVACCLPIFSYLSGGVTFSEAWPALLLFLTLTPLTVIGRRFTTVEIKITEDCIKIFHPITNRLQQILYSEIQEAELSDLTMKIYLKLKSGHKVSLGPSLEHVSGEFTVPVPGPAEVAGIGPRLKDEIESRIHKAKT